MGEDVEVPGEWGSGTWSEGISTLNYSTVASCELDDKGLSICLSFMGFRKEYGYFPAGTGLER